jgi:hypothetical protein
MLALMAVVAAGCSTPSSTAPSPTAKVNAAPSPAPGPTPDGPFIAGIVYDTAYRYLAGARIEVIDGPQAGMSTESDSQGRFWLTGAFDDTTRFVATKEGHLPATSVLGPFCAACHPNRWLYFTLEEPTPPPDLSGHWEVTFTTDAACTDMPSELRTRSYDATIALSPPASNPDARWLFVVKMDNVPFLSDYKEFHIAAAGSYLGFPENDGPVLVEQLDPTTYLSFNALGYMNGGVTGASAGAIITTGFDSAEYCVLTTPFEGTWFPCRPASLIADSLCTGNNRLTLIRR